LAGHFPVQRYSSVRNRKEAAGIWIAHKETQVQAAKELSWALWSWLKREA